MMWSWRMWVFRTIAVGALGLTAWCGCLTLVASAGPGYILLAVPLLMIVMMCEVELAREVSRQQLQPRSHDRAGRLEPVGQFLD